jgi:hypothetical protein
MNKILLIEDVCSEAPQCNLSVPVVLCVLEEASWLKHHRFCKTLLNTEGTKDTEVAQRLI